MNTRMAKWDFGDFGQTFRQAADASGEEPFKKYFGDLGREVGSLDAEFCRETAECGTRLASTMEELRSIGGRMGYCDRSRGFEEDCGALYGDVARAMADVETLRETCFV